MQNQKYRRCIETVVLTRAVQLHCQMPTLCTHLARLGFSKATAAMMDWAHDFYETHLVGGLEHF